MMNGLHFFVGHTSYPFAELQKFLDECSKSSFDRSSRRFIHFYKSSCGYRQVRALMVQLLHEAGPRDEHGVEFKWLGVSFNDCDILQRNAFSASHELDYSTLVDDMHRLLVSLARRAATFSMEDSPDIVTLLLNTPHLDHVDVDFLEIRQKNGLSDWEFWKLGTMIQQSLRLKRLCLCLPFAGVQPALLDGLANAIHLQSLQLNDKSVERDCPHSDETQSNLVVGIGDDNNNNGVVEQLLQNPHNQLRELNLSNMNLTEHHLIALLPILTTSHLEKIVVSNNHIESRGVLEFARQLARIPSLKRIGLRNNPWENSTSDFHQIGAALLQGVVQNTNLVSIDSIQLFPQARLLWYYLVLNKSGRGRILTTSSSSSSSTSLPEHSSSIIPDALWPYLLARQKSAYYGFSYDFKLDFDLDARADVIFFFLQHCPNLLSFR